MAETPETPVTDAPSVTVFTPAYNRAYILGELYRSLQAQTCRDFEWLIVDDGSADGTEALVSGWLQHNPDFPLRYIRQENGGKCRAINTALDYAAGRLFLTIDSDDRLTPDALEKIIRWEAALPPDGSFAAVAGNLGTAPDATPNTRFPEPFRDATFLERYRTFDGERAVAFYTDIHRRYRYPVFDGERFMTEAVVWNRMAHDGLRVRFYNDILCLYEYRDDGLTRAGFRLFRDNPRGYILWLTEKARFEHASRLDRLKLLYNITCELSPHYSLSQIASFTAVPPFLVRLLYGVHRFLNRR